MEKRLDALAEKAEVDRDSLIPINPMDFIEKTKGYIIRDYQYKSIGSWIGAHKTDGTYLISPLDDIEKTANQIRYKEGLACERVRASKCEVIPLHEQQMYDFLLRNHRQSAPRGAHEDPVTFGLLKDGQLLAVMGYSRQRGAIRGSSKSEKHELLRLAIAHGYSVNGGASRLQKHCEEALVRLGQHEIFSYSNATINSGQVYRQLGFNIGKVENGRAFVVLGNNKIVSLASLVDGAGAKNQDLVKHGHIKVHLGGSRCWTKEI